MKPHPRGMPRRREASPPSVTIKRKSKITLF
jgi:hypothetical protein